MPAFSKKSRAMLEQVHPDLQKVMEEAIKIIDFSITEGARTKEQQAKYVKEGKSKTMNSKHLPKYFNEYKKEYSCAIDICPYPVDYNDRERFCILAGIVLGIAKILLDQGKIKHRIRWGGDWSENNITKDEKFSDMPHFECKD